MADNEDVGDMHRTLATAHQTVSALRQNEGCNTLERTASSDIRKEKEDLKLAAEQSLNTIIDLGLDGTIRWVSPSWKDVVGYPADSVKGLPIARILLSEDKDAFKMAIESMKQDDHRSQIVRFQVEQGPSSVLRRNAAEDENPSQDTTGNEIPETQGKESLNLEGQGIMVYDRSSGGESHVRTN